MPAPENYVAGLGRGATGFTTRSDLGPAREGPSEEQMKEMLAKRAASLGQAAPSAYGVTEKKEEERDEEEDRFQDPDNEVGLFSSGMNYDKDDDEADRIYQEVDEKMDKRRRARRLVPMFSFTLCPSPLSLLSKYSSCFFHEQIPIVSALGKLASNKNETSTNETTPRSSSSLPI